MCCNQVRNTSTFRSCTNKKSIIIYHNLNCQSKYSIYLMKYTLCKMQYVRKGNTPFKIPLNNHRSNVSHSNAIPTCHNFAQSNNDFNTHDKFTIIETIANRNKPVKRGNVYINRLCTLTV